MNTASILLCICTHQPVIVVNFQVLPMCVIMLNEKAAQFCYFLLLLTVHRRQDGCYQEVKSNRLELALS